MGFGGAIATCFRKYVTFSGRARRPEYWWFMLFLLLAALVIEGLEGVAFGFAETAPRPIGAVFSLATLLPSLAVGWRRLQDVGAPGYGYLLPLAPLPLGLIAAPFGETASNVAFFIMVAAMIVLSIIVLIWTVSVSDEGDNRYGPEPGAATDVSRVFE